MVLYFTGNIFKSSKPAMLQRIQTIWLLLASACPSYDEAFLSSAEINW